MQQKCDILIVGGGIIGAAIAKKLSKFNKSIILLEKEASLGLHTSTRNSAVIHAGIYYSTDSLKAQFCKKGNQQLTQYIEDNKLPIKYTGKYIVATNDIEYETLKQVKNQAIQNGIDIEWLPVKEAQQREPNLNIFSQNYHVIYAPSTKVACNTSVIQQLQKDLNKQNNIQILNNTKFIDQTEFIVTAQNYLTKQKIQIEPKFTINCGGLYADKIAQKYGFCKNYEILPLKGTYFQTNTPLTQLKSLVYPVPPVKGSTVLGVHLTQTMDNHIKLGPNAIPAFWREQYDNNLTNFNSQEFLEIMLSYSKNFINQSSRQFYLQHAIQEIKKFDKNSVITQANKLAKIIEKQNNQNYYKQYFNDNVKSGIRAQLIDSKTRLPINDFIIETDNQNSMHLLNVVSPGWTCSFPIADHVIEKLQEQEII